MNVKELEKIQKRIEIKLMENYEKIKETDLFLSECIYGGVYLGIKESEGCMIEYLPEMSSFGIRSDRDFAVCLYNNGTICVCGKDESVVPRRIYYKNIEDFENNKSMLLKFKVEIVETYRRYVEVEAENEDAACQNIDNKINEGGIDLPCDGEDYKYDRELFVTKVKEDGVKQ